MAPATTSTSSDATVEQLNAAINETAERPVQPQDDSGVQQVPGSPLRETANEPVDTSGYSSERILREQQATIIRQSTAMDKRQTWLAAQIEEMREGKAELEQKQIELDKQQQNLSENASKATPNIGGLTDMVKIMMEIAKKLLSTG